MDENTNQAATNTADPNTLDAAATTNLQAQDQSAAASATVGTTTDTPPETTLDPAASVDSTPETPSDASSEAPAPAAPPVQDMGTRIGSLAFTRDPEGVLVECERAGACPNGCALNEAFHVTAEEWLQVAPANAGALIHDAHSGLRKYQFCVEVDPLDAKVVELVVRSPTPCEHHFNVEERERIALSEWTRIHAALGE